jgi:hypothetical protein
MDNKECKTIKQMADNLNISKQKVYRYIRKHRIKEAYQKCDTMYYNEAVEIQIRSYFSTNIVSNDVHQGKSSNTVNDTLISMLQKELEHKNQQLEAKDKQIADLSDRLADAQQAYKVEQALHAGTIQSSLIAEPQEEQAKQSCSERMNLHRDNAKDEIINKLKRDNKRMRNKFVEFQKKSKQSAKSSFWDFWKNKK